MFRGTLSKLGTNRQNAYLFLGLTSLFCVFAKSEACTYNFFTIFLLIILPLRFFTTVHYLCKSRVRTKHFYILYFMLKVNHLHKMIIFVVLQKHTSH